jgi:hypothetical protein
LHEGADVMNGSTHKTLPGPQGGMVLSDSGLAYGDADTNSNWVNPTKFAWDDFDWIRYACQTANSEEDAINLLTTEIQQAYKISQQPPIVPQSYYLPIYGTGPDNLGDQSIYVDHVGYIQDNYFIFKNINVSATGKSVLSNGSLINIAITNAGADYVPETTQIIIDKYYFFIKCVFLFY